MLSAGIPKLPRTRHSFHVSGISPRRFSHILGVFHGVVVISVRSVCARPGLGFSHSICTSPRVVVAVRTPGRSRFRRFMTGGDGIVVSFFIGTRVGHRVALLGRGRDSIVSAGMKDVFSYSV